MIERVLASLALFAFAGGWAQELPPLEAYGALPEADLFTMSPSGRYVAYRHTRPGEDRILVVDTETNERVVVADARDVNPRELVFVTEDRVVLIAGETVHARGVRQPFDANEVYVLDTASGGMRRVLEHVDELYPYQSGLGEIIGYDSAARALLMGS